MFKKIRENKLYKVLMSFLVIVLTVNLYFSLNGNIKKYIYKDEIKIISDITSIYLDIFIYIKLSPFYEKENKNYFVLDNDEKYLFKIEDKKYNLEYNKITDEIIIKNLVLPKMCSKTYLQTTGTTANNGMIFKDVVSFSCENNDVKVKVINFNGKIAEFLDFKDKNVIEL